MVKHFGALLLLTVSISTKSIATTWDEPWAKEVITKATSFVLAKVISNDPEKGVKIYIIKTLGGRPLTDTVFIEGFYLLDLCSTSGGHGPEFHISTTSNCYFFLRQDDKGKFGIATPTTGFDYVLEDDEGVAATYRHSYHQALVPIDIYEKTMTAIFNKHHNQPYDKEYIEKFVNEQLNKKPAGFEQDEIKTFFLQHAALETVYHLQLNVNENLVLPFLNDPNNFHNQMSGARAMSACNTSTAKQALVKAIGDTAKRNFVRVMCVWSLRDLKATGMKAQLTALEKDASDEEDDFGGNIMDSRICTRVPTLKEAIGELIKEL
jgi:hypothetical protein